MSKKNILVLLIIMISSVVMIAQEKPHEEESSDIHTDGITTSESIKTDNKLPTEVAWNKVCPVQGNPVEDNTPTVKYDGKIYGFCCPGCDVKFEKNPRKYSRNLSEDGSRYIGR
jgi:YHS domain-containing protein